MLDPLSRTGCEVPFMLTIQTFTTVEVHLCAVMERLIETALFGVSTPLKVRPWLAGKPGTAVVSCEPLSGGTYPVS